MTDRCCCEHHDQDCNHDRGDHHRQLVGNTDGGKNGIEREHKVNGGNLHNDESHQVGAWLAWPFFAAFHILVDFGSGLVQQEQPTAGQDHIADRKRMIEQGEKRPVQMLKPDNAR